MAGGKFSFASGGYFESPIDPLLETNRDIWILLHMYAVAISGGERLEI